jgi:sigma-E factor negative regulatory protein RseA
MNRDDSSEPDARRQALSALVDGDAAAADGACRVWRDDASARGDWHAYHLIGELMRSDDVRCSVRHDAQFLARLRERMAAEPVLLAPAATAAAPPQRARRAWAAPVAIAAGFAAVAGVLVVTRVGAPDAAAPERSAQLAAPALAASATDGRLIRNSELDRYLAAHKQYSSSSALALPGGAVRNAAAAAPGR